MMELGLDLNSKKSETFWISAFKNGDRECSWAYVKSNGDFLVEKIFSLTITRAYFYGIYHALLRSNPIYRTEIVLDDNLAYKELQNLVTGGLDLYKGSSSYSDCLIDIESRFVSRFKYIDVKLVMPLTVDEIKEANRMAKKACGVL